MRKITVKELMVPINEYPTVFEDDTIFNAVMALEKAQAQFDKDRYRHRAILVCNRKKHIIGKVSQWDLIKSLEPKYDELGDMRSISLSGFSQEFLKSMMEQHKLFNDNLNSICNRIAGKKVKDIMYQPTDGEMVEADATFGEAVHALIVGHHQSLLVIEGEAIVGILRLTDVFNLLCEKIKSCEI